MAHTLPTGSWPTWSATDFIESFLDELSRDRAGRKLRFFAYAVTVSGWNELGGGVRRWLRQNGQRSAIAYVGTDHGLTDPEALEAMQEDGVQVNVMANQGIFHPKVISLDGAGRFLLWVGSNNLSRDGLRHNIEFAILARSKTPPRSWSRWFNSVDESAVPLTTTLLASYDRERRSYARTDGQKQTFTWSRKQEPPTTPYRALRAGALLLEVMPEETRGGNQVQLPLEAARVFFSLRFVGDSTLIRLRERGSSEWRDLQVTIFANNTVRLSIKELQPEDRPCLLVLEKVGQDRIEFEIVSESIFPRRFRELLAQCTRRTREGSRRWAFVAAGSHPAP